MKKLTLLLALSVAVLLPNLVSAQATASNFKMTATSLSAAVTTTSANAFTVASATGITANNTLLWVDDGTGGNGEAVFVNAVNGTQISVTRGYNGTQANLHLSGSVVLAAPPANSYNPGPFVATDPSGSCTAASSWTPTVNIQSGRQWICSSISASWVPGYFNHARTPGVTTLVASAAGATNPTGPLFHISGTNAITAWGSSTTAGLGAGGGSATQPYGADFCVIPDGAYTTTATNNIAKATTGVVNVMQCWKFDGTAKKYVPTY
jgi:hypothetical protein